MRFLIYSSLLEISNFFFIVSLLRFFPHSILSHNNFINKLLQKFYLTKKVRDDKILFILTAGGSELKLIIVKADTEKSFNEYYRKYLDFISDKRAARAERIHSERDRIICVCAGLVVRSQISRCLGIGNSDISFDYGEHGKAFLHGAENFDFSLSHAGNYIAFICSDRSVGVDVESCSRGNEKIAKRYFTEEEYFRIYLDRADPVSFAEIWTAKEAYVKYTGAGLSEGLDTFNVLDGSTGCRFISFGLDDGYTVTVCTPSDEEVVMEQISMQQILDTFIVNAT